MHRRLPAILIFLLFACSSLRAARSQDTADYPVLPNEVISTSPAFNSTLDIYLYPMCEDDNIVFRVTRYGVPVPNVEVTLRQFQGGLHFEAYTSTTPDGWAVFTRRPAGRYDLTARIENVTMGQIFFNIPPCISPPSGVDFKPVPETKDVERAERGTPYTTQVFVNGLSREFYDLILPDGRSATRVVLRTGSAFHPDQWLSESIPLSIASSESSIGFEQDYPNQIDLNASLVLSWERGRSPSSSFSRSYVIYRSLTPQMVRQFGSPSLQTRVPPPFLNTSAANKTSTLQNTSSAPSSPIQASFDPWMIWGLLIPLAGVGGYMLTRRKTDTDKKAE